MLESKVKGTTPFNHLPLVDDWRPNKLSSTSSSPSLTGPPLKLSSIAFFGRTMSPSNKKPFSTAMKNKNIYRLYLRTKCQQATLNLGTFCCPSKFPLSSVHSFIFAFWPVEQCCRAMFLRERLHPQPKHSMNNRFLNKRSPYTISEVEKIKTYK